MWKIFAGILFGAVIIGAGMYFARQEPVESKDSQKVINKVSVQVSTNVTNPVESLKQPLEQAPSQNPEIIFADNLRACTPYKTTFKHLLTGETLEKEILGVIDGKCNYVEQMPNGGKMTCKYSETDRMAVAQYYKDIASAGSVGTSVQMNLGSNSAVQKTQYTINGKVVENPLQEATNCGVCVVSGY